MFYNTPLNTYIWVLTNRKEERRKGKIQLIDATALRTPLLKKLGDKSFQLSSENQRTIVDAFIKMETSPISHVYDNKDFGFWKIYIVHPQVDDNGLPLKDKKGKFIPDKTINDTEIVPFSYEGGIKAYIEKEVHPYAPYSWVDEKKTQIGYQVYDDSDVEKLVDLFLSGAERDRLDPILDACTAVYKQLELDDQIKFKSAAKSFVRTYGFLGAILPYGNVDWEKLSIFLNLLIPKLPSPRDDDLSEGILQTIDLSSYRNEAQEAIAIKLEDADAEIAPVPAGKARC